MDDCFAMGSGQLFCELAQMSYLQIIWASFGVAGFFAIYWLLL